MLLSFFIIRVQGSFSLENYNDTIHVQIWSKIYFSPIGILLQKKISDTKCWNSKMCDTKWRIVHNILDVYNCVVVEKHLCRHCVIQWCLQKSTLNLTDWTMLKNFDYLNDYYFLSFFKSLSFPQTQLWYSLNIKKYFNVIIDVYRF